MAKKPTKGEGQPPADEPLISLSGKADEFGRPVEAEPEERQAGDNAADEKQIEAKRKEAGQHKREDRDFWRICMSTPARRASFYRLLESCHIFGSAFDLGDHDARTGRSRPADVHVSYFRGGEENVGKRMMLAAMDASTDLYLTMLKEQKELRDARERKQDAS